MSRRIKKTAADPYLNIIYGPIIQAFLVSFSSVTPPPVEIRPDSHENLKQLSLTLLVSLLLYSYAFYFCCYNFDFTLTTKCLRSYIQET